MSASAPSGGDQPRRGEDIYPGEIEEFRYAHPDVLDAQVIGVPDELYGEESCAWVRMREGADPLTSDALREWSSGELARYKIPRYVRVVENFPMTVTGKVRTVEMRERSVELLGLRAPRPPGTRKAGARAPAAGLVWTRAP